MGGGDLFLYNLLIPGENLQGERRRSGDSLGFACLLASVSSVLSLDTLQLLSLKIISSFGGCCYLFCHRKENSEAPLPTYCPQKSLTPGYSSPSHNTTSALYPPRVTLGFHVSSYEPLLFLRQCPQCWVWGGEQHSLYFCYLVRNGKSQNLRWGNFIPRACANSCKSPMWKLLWSVLNYTSCLTLGGSFIFPLK